MRTSIRCYRAPKAGKAISECEDSVGYDEFTSAFAVSDGASASARAADWSARLVTSFLDTPPASRLDLASWWPAAEAAFTPVQDAPDTGWWSDEVARRGSFATFLGVCVGTQGRTSTWSAIAVGDSCVFQIRAGRAIAAFPMTDHGDFGSTPDLVGSVRCPERVLTATGELKKGDVIIGVSDALAAWALWRGARDRRTWDLLLSLQSQSFAAFIDTARSSGELEDDDVSLVRCEVIS